MLSITIYYRIIADTVNADLHQLDIWPQHASDIACPIDNNINLDNILVLLLYLSKVSCQPNGTDINIKKNMLKTQFAKTLLLILDQQVLVISP